MKISWCPPTLPLSPFNISKFLGKIKSRQRENKSSKSELKAQKYMWSFVKYCYPHMALKYLLHKEVMFCVKAPD